MPKLKNKKPSILAIGCFLPFFLLAIVAISYTTYIFYKSQDSKSWNPTEATILKTGMKSSRGHKGGRPASRATALYTYEVDGTKYQNDQVTFDIGKDNYEQSGLINRTFYHAKKIRIYVNPSDPKEATVIQGLTNSFILTILFLLLYLCFTYSMYQVFIKAMFPMGLVVFVMVAACGMFVLGTGLVRIDMKNKITVLEKAEEDKPPLELIIEDIRNGISNNSFKNYNESKEIFDIRVTMNKSIFNDRMPPYSISARFSYLENGVKNIGQVSIVYVKKDSLWEVYSYE